MAKLAPAYEERNSTVDVISGVLKTGQAESCSWQVCKFLIRRNSIRDYFLNIFFKFKSAFKKFGKESIFSSLATVILQHWLKRGLSKFLENLLFGTYHARVRFLNRVPKRRCFGYFTKNLLLY